MSAVAGPVEGRVSVLVPGLDQVRPLRDQRPEDVQLVVLGRPQQPVGRPLGAGVGRLAEKFFFVKDEDF